jgi:hypothetical protein
VSWFKVDDLLHGHRKARRAGLAAMGLWTLAGSWCAQQLEDGFVPEWFVLSWPGGDVAAKLLVEAGLWTEDTHEGEVGFRFHDWPDFQPSRAQVLAQRAATKERQTRWRERQRDTSNDTSRNGVTNTSPTRPDPSLKGGEPALRCPQHVGATDAPPCGACADARRAHDAWLRAQRAKPTTTGLPPTKSDARCTQPGHETERASHCRICAADQKGKR